MARTPQLPQHGAQEAAADYGGLPTPGEKNEIPCLAASRQPLSRLQWALLALLFVCALFLRGYDLKNPIKSTGDEYHYAWVGLSILHGEPPTAWSYLKAYDELDLHLGKIFHQSQFSPLGYAFVPVRPAFDHPPLYSLLAGTFAALTGAAKPVTYPMERYVRGEPLSMRKLPPAALLLWQGRFARAREHAMELWPSIKGQAPLPPWYGRPEDPGLSWLGFSAEDYVGPLRIWDLNLSRLRLLSLLLFAWSFVMLFRMAHRAYSFNIAFWSCLFYSATSHIIIHQRVAVTETLLAPMLLTNLYVMQAWLAGEISLKRFGIWTIMLSAAAPLTKLIALTQAGIIVFMLLAAGKRRAALFPIAGAALGLALYMLYGWIYGWSIFRAVLQSQSLRFNGFDSIEHMILKPFLFQTPNLSYVLFIGWLAVFAMAIAARGLSLFAAPLVYLCGFVFFAAATDIWGWHILCFYPFLCLGLGILANEGWKGDNTMAYLAIIVLFLPYLFQTSFVGHNRLDASHYRYAYLAAAGLLLGAVPWLPDAPRRRVYRLATAGVLGLVLANEVLAAWQFLFVS